MLVILAVASMNLGQPSLQRAEVGCILDAIPAAERPQLAQDALGGAGPERPSVARFSAVADECARQLEWTSDEAGTLAGLGIAIILRDDAAMQLSRAGISTAAIDAWLDVQSVAIRTNPTIEDAVVENLFLALQQAGAAAEVLDAAGETIGAYLGARIMIERIDRGLPIR